MIFSQSCTLKFLLSFCLVTKSRIKGTGPSVFLLFSAKRLQKKIGSFFSAKRLKTTKIEFCGEKKKRRRRKEEEEKKIKNIL